MPVPALAVPAPAPVVGDRFTKVKALNTSGWHRRFQEQAGWTHDIRRYLYQRANLAKARRILDVGCGTGVITAELRQSFSAQVFGLDLAVDGLVLAAHTTPQARFIRGNALALPFSNALFDVTLCHFLLLWLAHPQKAVSEMVRVTCRGGAILLLAEPDYGGRIDYPADLARIGSLQAEALHRHGADPDMGRKLVGLLSRAGLADIEAGVLGGQWQFPSPAVTWQSEWEMIENDLGDELPMADLAKLRSLDQDAWQSGERILFVPTFYAWGKVP